MHNTFVALAVVVLATGPTAASEKTDAKKNGITDGIVTLGNPRHIDVTADRAYR